VFGRLWARVKTLWTLAKNERGTPRELAWAIAIGVFSGCTPAVGFHGWVAVGLATLARKNRLFAWIGSRISNFLILPWIILAEVQLSHRLRTGAYAPLSKDHVLDQAGALLLDWILGSIPVGLALAALLGLVAYRVFVWRDARRAATPVDVATPPPAEALPPSSESPPSG
jgi:uncharacterized protein